MWDGEKVTAFRGGKLFILRPAGAERKSPNVQLSGESFFYSKTKIHFMIIHVKQGL